MDLAALEIFRAVAAEGSVTRAAERLGRVQSNVTTRVQQLEEQLGAPLFLREGRRMLLTPAGESLRGYADRLLALLPRADEGREVGAIVDGMRAAVVGLPGAGTVSVTAPDGVGTSIGPPSAASHGVTGTVSCTSRPSMR